MDKKHLVDIETKIAFQDNMIRELNEVVCRQQGQIDELSETCRHLEKQIRSMSGVSTEINPKDEKPPHY